MRFILLLPFLFAVLTVQAQLPEFSDLSSRNINRLILFHSLRVDDGILYFAPTDENVNMLYKVGFDGALLDSVNLSEGDYKYRGHLMPYEDGKVLLVGEANKPFVSYHQGFTDRRAVVLVLNEELDIISTDLYDILPYSAGATLTTQTGDPATYIHPANGIGVIGDTVFAVKQYYYFDTLTFAPTGNSRVIERVVINGPALPNLSINPTSADAYTAVFTDQSIYVYGQSSECCGGALIDPAAVGEYDHAGNFIQKHVLLETFLDFDPTWAAVGNRVGDRIYNSFVDEGFIGEPCKSAMIDVRDLDFQLLRNAKVPDCDMAPSGTKCVAVSNHQIYYLTINSDYNLGLYKYDTLLNLVWGKLYDFEEPHLGISLNSTPDGGVVLECAIDVPESSSPDILKLYKISPTGDIVSSSKIVLPTGQNPVVYPNPFTSQLSIKGLPIQPTTVQLYDQLGRLVFTGVSDGQSVDFNTHFLNPGTYLLSFRNTATGELLHSQWVVKAN